MFVVQTDNSGFEYNSPEYTLYKNTVFKDCYNTSVSATTTPDCPSIKAILQQNNSAGAVGTLGHTTLSQSGNSKNNNSTYSWCEVMTCYNDFKIIPSTPRPSAFWPTLLEAWDITAITFLLAFWQFRKMHKALYSDKLTRCKGFEWDTWLILAWDLASFIWWCFGFGRFTLNPARYPAPSMLGWVAMWKYSYMLNYHPYECVIRRAPETAQQIAQWTLNILATLLWIASAYICTYSFQSADRKWSPYDAYDCLASRVADAPGASTCSAEQICSKKTLFSSYTFRFPNQYFPGVTNFLGTFVALSIAALYMVCALGIFPVIRYMLQGGSIRKWRERVAKRYDFGFTGGICLASVGYTIYGALTIFDAVQAFKHGREGPVTFYWDCTALHVNVSPWRYYLDVNSDRVVRLAKMWFNS